MGVVRAGSLESKHAGVRVPADGGRGRPLALMGITLAVMGITLAVMGITLAVMGISLAAIPRTAMRGRGARPEFTPGPSSAALTPPVLEPKYTSFRTF